MITIEQIKAARLFLHMDQVELARLAGVSLPTIQRVENPKFGPDRSSMRIIRSIKDACEGAGIEFIAAGEGKGEGVRLAKTPESRSASDS